MNSTVEPIFNIFKYINSNAHYMNSNGCPLPKAKHVKKKIENGDAQSKLHLNETIRHSNENKIDAIAFGHRS